MTVYKNAFIFNTESRSFEPGDLCVKDGYIIENTDCNSGEIVNLHGAYVIPGLIDVHTHGRCGHDSVETSADEIIEMAYSYAKAGTTSFLPTVMSVPLENIESSLDNIASAIEKARKATRIANILGVHLEGRYLNPKRKGAHNPQYLTALDADELSRLINRFRASVSNPERYCIHITCAPELDSGEKFVKRAVELSTTVAIGHSDATSEECKDALEWGANAFTHLFNAMSPLSHRAPGCVGAALSSDAYTELICDGRHIAPEVVRLTYRAKAKDRLVLVTDSAPAAGYPEGNYKMGGADIIIENGAAWLPDGTLTGSVIDMFTAVKNLAEYAGIPLTEAIPCATINPACMIGADHEIGSLEAGKRADFIVTDSRLSKIAGVYINGEKVE